MSLTRIPNRPGAGFNAGFLAEKGESVPCR